MAQLPPGQLSSTAQLLLALITDGSAHNRADLARLTGRAPSTISIYINELLTSGLVIEAGETASTGGRKGRRLQLADTGSFYYMVGDLAADHIRLAIASPVGELASITQVALPADESIDAHFAAIRHACEELRAHTTESGELAGVSIGVPAPVDVTHGWVHSSARIPQWNHFPLIERLTNALQVPVIIENDANLIALAQARNDDSNTDSITLTAGRGIGVGIILNGTIHHGATGNAGDISHVRHTTYGDALCPCGNRGCLTTVAALDALTEKWAAHGEKGTPEAFLAAARRADPIATNILRQAGEQLGIALSTVVSFFNPSAVYLSGPLADIDVYVSAIRTCIYGSCHPLQTRSLRIEKGKYGLDAELHGAALLAHHKHTHS